MQPLLTILCNATPAGLETASLAFEVTRAAAGGPSEWIQLTPRGAVTARDGRKFSFHPETLVEAFAASSVHLPVDFEHESEFVKELGARPARGWIVDLQARAVGLFGRVEWLQDAAAALAARQYRYISPTFWADADGTARAIKSAALVNAPALGLPALASLAISTNTSTDEDVMLKEIMAALGLPETATAAAAFAAIATLKAAADPALFVPAAQHKAATDALATAQAQIKQSEDAAKAVKCATLIDDGVKAGKIAPAAKAHYLALASVDFDKTKSLVDDLPVILAAGAGATVDATKAAGGALTADELAVCAALGVTAEQFLVNKKAA